eukprot:gene1089-1026_t
MSSRERSTSAGSRARRRSDSVDVDDRNLPLPRVGMPPGGIQLVHGSGMTIDPRHSSGSYTGSPPASSALPPIHPGDPTGGNRSAPVSPMSAMGLSGSIVKPIKTEDLQTEEFVLPGSDRNKDQVIYQSSMSLGSTPTSTMRSQGSPKAWTAGLHGGGPLKNTQMWPSVSDVPSSAAAQSKARYADGAAAVGGGVRMTGADSLSDSDDPMTKPRRTPPGQKVGHRISRNIDHALRSPPNEYNPAPQPVPGLLQNEVRYNPVNLDFTCPAAMSDSQPSQMSPSARPSEYGVSRKDRIVLVMVGLPARGKSHIARRIQRYMEFFHGVPSKIFNIGSYRRKLYNHYHPPSFFDPKNTEAMKMREECLNAALKDLNSWVASHDVCVGLLDATNTTRKRRKYVFEQLTGMHCKVIFCESIVTDQSLIDRSIVSVKTQSADFKGQGKKAKEVLSEFKERIRNYETVYEPISETDEHDRQLSWIKVINTTHFVYNHIYGTYPSHILSHLMSLHLEPRTFYLVRHGQTEYDAQGRIGGDSSLTAHGKECAGNLAKWMHNNLKTNLGDVLDDGTLSPAGQSGPLSKEQISVVQDGNVVHVPANVESSLDSGCGSFSRPVITPPTEEADSEVGPANNEVRCNIPVFTSTLLADNQMSKILSSDSDIPDIAFKSRQWRNLDQVYAGDFDGLTAEEIRREHPEELEMRRDARLTYRYPRGESVADIIMRLESVINAMEQSKKPIIVIAHHAVLNVIYAYWKGLDREQVPYIRCPAHRITKLTVSHYGTTENDFSFMQAPLVTQPTPSNLDEDDGSDDDSPEMCLDDSEHCHFPSNADNPTPQHPPGTEADDIDNPVSLQMAQKNSLYGTSRSSLVIVLVGLSAKGRTHMANRIQRYLTFFHAVKTQVFPIRYEEIPDTPNATNKSGYSMDAPSYRQNDAEKYRQKFYEDAIDNIKAFIKSEGVDGPVCSILDGRCVTKRRRNWVRENLSELTQARVLLVECDIMHQAAQTKLEQTDIEHFEPLTTEEDCTWIKLSNSYRTEVNKPMHDVTMPLILFLMNVHAEPHVFYLSRHGQSQYNLEGKIGGDSELTDNGELYAKKLSVFAERVISRDENGNYAPVRLWTSTLKRTNMTVKHIKGAALEIQDPSGKAQNWINFAHKQYRNLDEIYAGDCDGLTYLEIQEQYPDEFARRQKHRLAYRYPRGESYLDLIQRLHPMILEMERLRENLLIVAHQAVIRMILAYWTNTSREEAAKSSVPLNTVLKITVFPFEIKVERLNVMDIISLKDVDSEATRDIPARSVHGQLPPEQKDPDAH